MSAATIPPAMDIPDTNKNGAQTETPLAVYPRVLGHSWNDLDQAIRRIHNGDAHLRAEGRFTIRHGHRLIARWLVRIARMPAPGVDVPTELTIRCDGDFEQWRRTFGGHPMNSTQHATASGRLLERFGPMLFEFALHVERRALVFQQCRALLTLGPFLLPLPRWMAPLIHACEEPDPNHRGVRVTVSVQSFLFGPLFFYDGWIGPAGYDR